MPRVRLLTLEGAVTQASYLMFFNKSGHDLELAENLYREREGRVRTRFQAQQAAEEAAEERAGGGAIGSPTHQATLARQDYPDLLAERLRARPRAAARRAARARTCAATPADDAAVSLDSNYGILFCLDSPDDGVLKEYHNNESSFKKLVVRSEKATNRTDCLKFEYTHLGAYEGTKNGKTRGRRSGDEKFGKRAQR